MTAIHLVRLIGQIIPENCHRYGHTFHHGQYGYQPPMIEIALTHLQAVMYRYGMHTTGTNHGYGKDTEFTHKK